MQSLSVFRPADEIDAAFEAVAAISPTALFVFAAPALWRNEAYRSRILARTAGVSAIGCSTAGEISNAGVGAGGISVLGIRFARTAVRTVSVPLDEAQESFAAGRIVGEELRGPKLKAVFLLGPGTDVNGSALTDGVCATLGRDVVVSGGLAGDEVEFKETCTLEGAELYHHRVVAMGFYGDDVSVSCGSEGGWRPFGPARRVTRAEGHVLLELDGKPALELYKQYLGEKARHLPASGMSYPFAILRGDRTTSGVIRSALDIDHVREALILAGDIPQGAQVCLMHADTDALTQGAAQAAAEALRTHKGGEAGGCAFVVSCVGRRVVYGIDADEEIEAVTDSFLPGTPIAGYYSYGEICSYAGTGRAELHNQTMTITYITENAPLGAASPELGCVENAP